MFRKLVALALVAAAVFSFVGALADAGPQPDWKAYDQLMAKILTVPDMAQRAVLMHQAEEMLMATGAVLPLTYNQYMYVAKPGLSGYYNDVHQTNYFMYAQNGKKNKMGVHLNLQPETLDPAFVRNGAFNSSERTLVTNLFGGLYTYNPEGMLVPNFATAAEVSGDGLTYVFTMREGLKWSDGSSLDAKDFEYAWKRAASSETGAWVASHLFSCIQGSPEALEAAASEDGKTLTVHLSQITPYFLDILTFPPLSAVKQEAVEGAAGYKDQTGKVINPGAWAQEPGFVTSGAFILQQNKKGKSLVFAKNPNYWDADNVKLEQLEFVISNSDTAPYNAYKKGSLDFIDILPGKKIKELLKAKKPEIHFSGNLMLLYAFFNVKSPLFDGKTADEAANMRKGISLLIDRKRMAGDSGLVANSLIPPGMMDGNGQLFKLSSPGYTYPLEEGYFPTLPDINKARELLSSSGFVFDRKGKLSKETPLSFTCVYEGFYKQAAEWLQKDFAQIGISMTIKDEGWDTFYKSLREGSNDFVLLTGGSSFNDPLSMLREWMGNRANYAQLGK